MSDPCVCWSCRARRAAELAVYGRAGAPGDLAGDLAEGAGRAAAADLVERLRPAPEVEGDGEPEAAWTAAPRGLVH